MKRGLGKYFGKRDMVLLVALAVGIVVLFVLRGVAFAQAGARVTVTVDGAVFGTYPLDVDARVVVPADDGEDGNVITIADGAVRMSDATCPDRLCVRQGAIDREGQSIVCLPHRVVVTVSGTQDAPFDSMTR